MAFFKTLPRKTKEEPAPVEKEPEVEHEPTSVGVRRTYGSMSVSRSGRFKSKNRQRKTILTVIDHDKSDNSQGSDPQPKQDGGNKSSAHQTSATSKVTTTATTSSANKNQTSTATVNVTNNPTSPKSVTAGAAQQTIVEPNVTTTSSKSAPAAANQSSAQETTPNVHATTTSSTTAPTSPTTPGGITPGATATSMTTGPVSPPIGKTSGFSTAL